jgi:hypothetical protein
MSINADKLDAYTIVAIIIPGAVLALALLLMFPAPLQAFAPAGMTFGSLGVYLVLSFALGHLLQAIGNFIEAVYSLMFGGLPTDQVRKQDQGLIARSQRDALILIVQKRWGIDFNQTDIDRREWRGATRRMYVEVAAHQRTRRLDAFNADYGLNRGIAAALMCVSLTLGLHDFATWPYILGAAGAALLALYRMHRRGRQYAVELFLQFLSLPDRPGSDKPQSPALSNS